MDICYKIILSPEYDSRVRNAFTKLTTNLWVDRSPFYE